MRRSVDRSRAWRIWPIWLALALAPVSQAAEIPVRGRVLDPRGDAFAGARVELLRIDSRARDGREGPDAIAVRTASDAEGRFRVAAPAAGMWAVRVSAAGFAPLEYPLRPLSAQRDLPPAQLTAGGEPDDDGSAGWPGVAGEGWCASGEPPAEQVGPAVAIRGRVVDLLDGGPVADAWIWPENDPGNFARSGADGDFELAVPRRGRLLAAGERHVHGFVVLDTAGDEPSIALKPAASIAGEVSDARGEALADVEVWVAAGSGAGDEQAPRLRTMSWHDGRFRLAGLPAGADLELWLLKPGFAPAELDLGALEAFETRDGLAVRLRMEVRGVGRVVDAEKRPVAGAAVRLMPAPPAGTGLPAAIGGTEDEVATDDAGRFETPGLTPGRYDLTVAAAGFAPLTVPGLEIGTAGREPAPTVDLGTIFMIPGVAIEGRIADPEGHPIAGAGVWIAGARPAAERAEPAAESDAAGAFAVADLEEGELVRLWIHKPGYAALDLGQVEAPTAEPLAVILLSAGRLAGRVVDSEGRPVAAATLDYQVTEPDSPGRQPEPRDLIAAGERAAAERPPSTGTDGRFELEVAPGVGSLSVAARGFQPFRMAGVEVPAGGETGGLEVVLAAGARLEGRVSDPRGEPAIGASVQVFDPAGPSPDALGSARSGGDGSFAIDGLPAGALAVAASHDRYLKVVREVDVGPEGATVELSFAGGFEVAGRVSDRTAAPLEGAHLILNEHQGLGAFRTDSSADGEFAFRDVPPGTYYLFAGLHGYYHPRPEGPIEVRDTAVAGLAVELTSGARLEGRILGLEIGELSRVVITASGDGRTRHGQVDFEGRYTISGLAPGDWRVTAVIPDGGRQAQDAVTLEPGVPLATLDLDFGDGYRLSGTVLHGDQPVRGVRVLIHGLESGAVGHVLTDPAGAFAFTGLAAGGYRLEITGRHFGLPQRREIVLDGDLDVAIELRAARVGGLVRDADDGRGIGEATVRLEGLEVAPPGPRLRRTVADSHGRFRFLEVPAGRWRLAAFGGGYGPAETELEISDGDLIDDLTLELRATEGISLVARLDSGQISPRVAAAVLGPRGQPMIEGLYQAGGDGRVRISSVPVGTWQLLLRTGTSATANVTVTAPGDQGEVALPKGCSLRVLLPELEDDASPAEVRLLSADGTPYQALDSNGRVRQSWPLHRGAARLERLPPGWWLVQVTAGDGRAWQQTASVKAAWETEAILR